MAFWSWDTSFLVANSVMLHLPFHNPIQTGRMLQTQRFTDAWNQHWHPGKERIITWKFVTQLVCNRPSIYRKSGKTCWESWSFKICFNKQQLISPQSHLFNKISLGMGHLLQISHMHLCKCFQDKSGWTGKATIQLHGIITEKCHKSLSKWQVPNEFHSFQNGWI